MVEYIYFNQRGELLRQSIANIAYFEADGNYTKVVSAWGGLASVISMSLGDMEKALADRLGNEATVFIRLGRRYIVNSRYIYKISLYSQTLVLTDYSRFTFKLSVSKDALRQLKHLYIPEKK